jgi:DNA-binding transcriptional MocR family regulator
VRCEPEQIIAIGGTRPAVDVAIRVLLDRYTEVWVEDPCYPVTYDALVSAEVKIRPIPVDAHGMDVGAGVQSNARYPIDRQPSRFDQTVVAEFMRQGYFAAHIRRMRLLYRDQRYALVAELTRRAGGNVTVDVPDQGMHLIAYLQHRLSDVVIEQAARQRGVIVRAIRHMYKNTRPRSGLILGFSRFSCEAIVPAAARFAMILSEAAP